MTKKGGCGCCGADITAKNERKEYNSLCSNCPVPHNIMRGLGGGRFRCDYCGRQGEYNWLNMTDCTHVYEKCDYCGEHPFCAKDCSGIAEALSNPDVYVAGFIPADEGKNENDDRKN